MNETITQEQIRGFTAALRRFSEAGLKCGRIAEKFRNQRLVLHKQHVARIKSRVEEAAP